MEYPKLKVRPQSVQTCTSFRGLDRRPGASSRTRNRSWQWYWHDERNLSADRAPRLSVRKGRTVVSTLDGNDPVDDIVASCGGDHLLLLDRAGYLWCNGHSVRLNSAEQSDVSTEITHDSCSGTPTITLDPDMPWIEGDHARTVTFRVKDGRNTGVGQFVADLWETDESGAWEEVETADLANYGITWSQTATDGIYIGWAFYVRITVNGYAALGDPQMVRMGADVVITHSGALTYWANAVRLASGQVMTEGTHYGVIPGKASAFSPLSLTLCDIDGNAYSGVVVSATEPTQEGYWLDTSGDKPVLQEWSVSQSMWIKLTSTYVKISSFAQEAGFDTIRKGDAVTLEAECANGTDPDVVTLLNGTHYLYDADVIKLGTGAIIVAGVLPSDTVSVTLLSSAVATREPPTLDFVVEAQNRLWGCRYDESKSINEIYASKLGDYRNWEVYQGLSTDSWRASRGTAAPFTGAVTMGGNPLFFREESLEKVFPSASGAHQIAVYALDGVQKGSEGSMVIIDERLFYKSRSGVCVYSGTLPTRISDEFDDWSFTNAKAGRYGKKYVVCMDRSGKRYCMVYDLETGDWHVEDGAWDGPCVSWKEKLYYLQDGKIYAFAGTSADGIDWYAESDELTMELPEHKWVQYIRIRLQLDLGAEVRVYVAYDGGDWERKAAMHGNRMNTREAMIWPRRCDHFRLRLEGTGGCELQSISYRVERSQGGH